MWADVVVWRPGLSTRGWAAMRWPRWKISAGHGPQPDPEASGHRSVTQPQGPLLSEDLSNLTHGQSLGRQRAPFVRGGGRAGPSSVARSGARPRGAGSPVHHPPIYVFTIPIPVFTMDRSG